jgi:hypothetical protein
VAMVSENLAREIWPRACRIPGKPQAERAETYVKSSDFIEAVAWRQHLNCRLEPVGGSGLGGGLVNRAPKKRNLYQ